MFTGGSSVQSTGFNLFSFEIELVKSSVVNKMGSDEIINESCGNLQIATTYPICEK